MTETRGPSSTEKHPISVGQPTRETTCWREHTEGFVCLLDEGHEITDEAADLRRRVAKVMTLHIPDGWSRCQECGTGFPCKTVRCITEPMTKGSK